MLSSIGTRRALVPWAIMGICAVVGGLGAGASTPAIVGPFAFTVAMASGVDPVLTALAVCFGNLIGSNNPYNGYGGVINKNLILENGTDPLSAQAMSHQIWLNCSLMCVVIIGVFYLWSMFRNRRKDVGFSNGVKAGASREKVRFTTKQRITLTILLGSCALMVVPGLLNLWIRSDFLQKAAGLLKPQMVMIAAALLCSVLELAPRDEVVQKMPVNSILMITGMYVLIALSAEAGLTKFSAEFLRDRIPVWILPGALTLTAAFLSFFSSTTSTVMPLMYPLVPYLSAATGFAPAVLYSCIFFGGLSADISPFSTGGALTIAGCPDLKIKETLAGKMVIRSFLISLMVAVAAQLGLFSIFVR